jgi:hypothetical protein
MILGDLQFSEVLLFFAIFFIFLFLFLFLEGSFLYSIYGNMLDSWVGMVGDGNGGSVWFCLYIIRLFFYEFVD